MQEPKYHPYCLLFPESSQADYEKVRDSISDHGQREPIVMLGEEILDGRTRLKAATELKTPPIRRQFDPAKDGDPLTFVIDKNLNRRHLTVGQRAALAVDIEKAIKDAKEAEKASEAEKPVKTPTPNGEAEIVDFPKPDKEGERPRTLAAKQAGVSTGSVAKAKELEEKDPERFKEVKSGEKSLDAAHKESKSDPKQGILGFQDSKPDAYRKEASELIAPSHGDKFAAAVLAGTILKDRELREFMKLPIADQMQIAKLVANQWKVRAAVKFAKGIFEQSDAIRELVNLANMHDGKAVVSVSGYAILVWREADLAHPLSKIVKDTRDEQNEPEKKNVKPTDNTLAKAFEKAKPEPKGKSSRPAASSAGSKAATPKQDSSAASKPPGKPAEKKSAKPAAKKAAKPAPKAAKPTAKKKWKPGDPAPSSQKPPAKKAGEEGSQEKIITSPIMGED